MKSADDLPKVEHGIKMPKKYLDGRNVAIRERSESAWVGFLKLLNVGDSFVILPWQLACVQTHAKKLELDLVHVRETGGERVWLYGKPGKRNPIYQRMDGRTFMLTEIEK